MKITDKVDYKLMGYNFDIPVEEIFIPYGKKTALSKIVDISSISHHKIVAIKSLMPHMHRAGVRYKFEIVEENGKEKFLAAGDFDFRHAIPIVYDPPITLKNKKIKMTCLYDNSPENPNIIMGNVNKKDIKGGGYSDDEMCNLLVNFKVQELQDIFNEFK